MYAVVDIKGFQYKIEKGDRLKVPKCDIEIGKKITFPEVLLVFGDKDIKIGTPFVEGAVVEATVTGQGKGEKITVFKKKRRKDYFVKRGHRQEYTEIEIKNIKIKAAKIATSKAAKKTEPVKAPAKKKTLKKTQKTKAVKKASKE